MPRQMPINWSPPSLISSTTMPVLSAASPSTRSQTSQMQTPMSYEKFRPRFPLDPFAGADQAYNTPTSARASWTLDADALPLPSILQYEQRVVLIIGQASATSLTPLFASRHLASSLLIIASHRPPALPFDTYPSVYTLRLRTPLAIADGGATRLMGVLEWALQVAKLWRRSGGPKKQELMEELSAGSESVPLGQSFGRLRYSSIPESQQDHASSSAFSPGASMTSLAPSTTRKSRRFSLFKRQSSQSLVPDPANARPFDALLHFLSADAPDKARLKAMILVTTLTRPYLTAPPTRGPSTRFYSELNMKSSSKSGKRWSFFRSSSNVASPSNSSATLSASNQSRSTSDLTEGSRTRHNSLASLAMLRTRRSRLLHLMPSAPASLKAPTSGSSRLPASNSNSAQAQAHIIRSIEAFLLSFCFSVSPELPIPIAGFAASDAECAKARPYVLPATALREVLEIQNDPDDDEEEGEGRTRNKRGRNEWTLAELILSGALECEAESTRPSTNPRSNNDTRLGSDESGKGKERQVGNDSKDPQETGWREYRAWVGSVREIVVMHSTSLKQVERAHVAPPKSRSQPLLSSQTHTPSNPPSSQNSSWSRPQSPQSRPVVYPKAVRSQAGRSQDQAYAGRPTDSDPITNAKSTLRVDTKRRTSKKSGYKSLAIQKRLPTPPEDENEEIEGAEIEASSTISNATSCTRSPVDDNEQAQRVMAGTSRLGPAVYELKEMPRRRPYEKTRSRALSSGHHQRHESLPLLSEYSSTQSSSRAAISQPSPSYPSASSSAISSSSATTRDTSSHQSSSRYQTQSKPEKPLPRGYEVHKAEAFERDVRYGYTDKQQQYLESGSLPTPPDSEKASFEGVSPDIVVSASAPASHSRGSNHVGDGQVPPSRGEQSRGQAERRHDRVRDTQKSGNERERERERRRRSYSQPPPPQPGPAVDDCTPPRRSRTKPKERPPSRERERERSSLDRHVSDLGAILNKPLRPDLERAPASSGDRDRERERERERGERRPGKPEESSKPETKRNGSSSPEERERVRRAGGASSAIKRVPVPAIEDGLPALSRKSKSQPGTSRNQVQGQGQGQGQSRSRTPQASSSAPTSRSQSSSQIARAKVSASAAGRAPSERERRDRGDERAMQQHHTKWRFWKGGPEVVSR